LRCVPQSGEYKTVRNIITLKATAIAAAMATRRASGCAGNPGPEDFHYWWGWEANLFRSGTGLTVTGKAL
jgi:hypothetical protein